MFVAVATWLLQSAVVVRAGTDFKAGLASIDITPPVGWRLAGGFTERISTNKLSPLMARALVLQQGRERAAIVVCDIGEIEAEFSIRTRQRASQRTGIPPGNILLAATQTPNGALYFGAWRQHLHISAVGRDGRDLHEGVDYAAILAEQIADVIGRASRAAQPVRIEAGRAPEPVLAPNGESAGAKRDGEFSLMLLLNEKGNRALGIFSAVGLPAGMARGRSISAGYSWPLELALGKSLGAEFVAMSGVGPGAATSPGVKTEDVASESARWAKALSQTLLNTIPSLKPVKPSLAVTSGRVNVTLPACSPQQVAAAREKLPRVGTGKLSGDEEREVCRILDQQQLGRAEMSLEVQAIRVGADLVIVGLPGEPSAAVGLAIKKASPFKHTLVLTHCNDATGLPEVAAESVRRAAVELLQQLK